MLIAGSRASSRNLHPEYENNSVAREEYDINAATQVSFVPNTLGEGGRKRSASDAI